MRDSLDDEDRRDESIVNEGCQRETLFGGLLGQLVNAFVRTPHRVDSIRGACHHPPSSLVTFNHYLFAPSLRSTV